MADFLAQCGVNIQQAFHSGKPRAEETARIILSRVNPRLEPEMKTGLSPMDDVHDIARHINAGNQDLLIAGHLPHLIKLVSFLIYGNESTPVVHFEPGALACLEKGEEARWTVAWMVFPELVQKMAL